MSFLLAPKPFDVSGIFSNLRSKWYYYAAFACVALLVILVTVTFKPQQRLKLKSTLKITVYALLIALCSIGNALLIGTGDWQISFMQTTAFISGFFFGPLGGFAITFLGDLIQCIIRPAGIYDPVIALATALWGFFFGLLFNYFKGKPAVKLAAAYSVGFIVCSVALNTVARYYLYTKFFAADYPTAWAYFIYKLPMAVVGILLNFTVCLLLYKPLEKIKSQLIKKSAARY